MRPPASSSLSDASVKGYDLLRRWEELAPLNAEQLTAIDAAAQQIQTRRLPEHLTNVPTIHDTPLQSDSSTAKSAVLQSTQAFYQWHARMEALRISEAEEKYEEYVNTLNAQLTTCQEASEHIHSILTALDTSITLYKDAVGRSRSLRETGEKLLQEQEQLTAFAEAIRDRLCHFEQLESIAAEFHSLASSLSTTDLQFQSTSVFQGFLSILKRLDDCISYVTSNPQYAESASYETRFRQLHSRALGGILHRVREILKATAKDLTAQPGAVALAVSEAEQTNDYYVKFRALVEEQLQAVLVELAERSTRPEYKKLYDECKLAFCRVRSSLMQDLVKRRVAELRTAALDTLLRDGFSYLVEICRSEHQLFMHFFPDKEENIAALSHLMESIGTVLYDDVRPRLIAMQSLDSLCEYVSILKTEINEGQIDKVGPALDALKNTVLRTLADAQERLIFRAQAFIEEVIDRHEPTTSDIESLSLLTRADATGDSEVNITDRKTWYIPLRRTVDTLESLYEALEPGVFSGIAHNAITVCTLSISKALPMVSKAKSVVDGQLFAIRHLLLLREELIRFRMDFLLTEKDLDFTHMRDHMRRVLSGEVSVFQLPASSMAQLVTWTAPRVTDTQVDSKKRLEKQLKESCESLIMTVTKSIVEPLLAFLTKVSALRGSAAEERQLLSQHAFASSDRLTEIVSKVNEMLESTLPQLVQKMKSYLPQQGTFDTLYKPIKANIIDAHIQVAMILEKDYTHSDIHAIQLKSREQLTTLLDAM